MHGFNRCTLVSSGHTLHREGLIMDRRQFIRDVFLWSVGATLTIPRFNILSDALAAEKPESLLSLAKGEDYFSLVSRAST